MKVQDLLTDESKWCQEAEAMSDFGPTWWGSRCAFSWCLVGAVHKCYPNSIDERAEIYVFLKCKLAESPVSWNDAPERTFAEVRALIEELDI